MSDGDEPVEPEEPEERDGGPSGGRSRGDAGRSAGGAPAASAAFSTRVSIVVTILGPILLTTAYFTLPFEAIGPHHDLLAWVVLTGILALLAMGMVVTTNRILADKAVRFRHPGVAIVLMSWTAILAFAACYWAMATRKDQFVGLQTRLDSLYFTGITMSTVGYGDIHPSGQLARAVVLVQLAYTFAFLVGGIAAIKTHARAKMALRMDKDKDKDKDKDEDGGG